MYSACAGPETTPSHVDLSKVSHKENIQITKGSFRSTNAALTDMTRTSEAAQTASDVYAEPDRQDESRATRPTSPPNNSNQQVTSGFILRHSALTRH